MTYNTIHDFWGRKSWYLPEYFKILYSLAILFHYMFHIACRKCGKYQIDAPDTRPLINSFTFASLKDFLFFVFPLLIWLSYSLSVCILFDRIIIMYFGLGWTATQQHFIHNELVRKLLFIYKKIWLCSVKWKYVWIRIQAKKGIKFDKSTFILSFFFTEGKFVKGWNR